MNNLNNFLPVLSIAISVMVVLGGYWAFRQGFFKQSSEIQEQTINALKTRVDTLEGQLSDAEKKIARLEQDRAQSRQLISTIRHALERRGLHIEIENDGTNEIVTIIDAEGQRSQSAQVPSPTKIRPVKLRPIKNRDNDAS